MKCPFIIMPDGKIHDMDESPIARAIAHVQRRAIIAKAIEQLKAGKAYF